MFIASTSKEFSISCILEESKDNDNLVIQNIKFIMELLLIKLLDIKCKIHF